MARCMRVEFHEKRVMFTGGGTAGHVNPGLAVYHAMQRAAQPHNAVAAGCNNQYHLCAIWVGSERIESTLVPQAGMSFRQIDIRFSYRRPTPGNWAYYRQHILPLLLGRPFRQALATLDIFQPELVVGTGGYVAAPVLWAAIKRNVPIALIQCDSPPGLVNWHFADRAWRIFTSTREVAQGFTGRCANAKIIPAGFPVLPRRRSREALCAELGIDASRRLLVAMGGSLGAGAVQAAIQEMLSAAEHKVCSSRRDRLAVLNIGGSRGDIFTAMPDQATVASRPVAYYSTGYLEHAIDALYAADFYIGRAGAATVGELVAAGTLALLIPDPQHADRQQYANAEVLVRLGQGVVLEQGQATGRRLLDWLESVWDAPRPTAPLASAADEIATELAQLWAAG